MIEPFLTDQWYVDAKTLAKDAIAAVRDGRTTFVPKNWEKTYFDWMENIQPWCVSRQLWWGHQIPAWYGPEGKLLRRRNRGRSSGRRRSPSTPPMKRSRPRKARRSRTIGPPCTFLTRDEDVLDTWFSSALWPFSTLGWPDETPELKRYYPTNVLVTGFDIIFFWVARMMMMGLHFMKEVPFHTVYIHRAGARRRRRQDVEIERQCRSIRWRSSTSSAPMRLRFTLARNGGAGQRHQARHPGCRGQSQLRDQALERRALCRIERLPCRSRASIRQSAKETLNRWIAHETAKAALKSAQAIETYSFGEAAGAAYRFVWNVYCDWYVELSKPLLTGPDGAAKDRDARDGGVGAR